jgi:hypothetical protein
MFESTASVYSNNTIVPFSNPSCIGNQALYMLITAPVDNFYRHMLHSLDGFGDKALQKLSSYCANVAMIDKSYYHHQFTTLHLLDNESVTHFLKNFVITQTKAEIAGNTYSDADIVDLILATLNSTSKTKYLVAVQLYLAK